MAVACCLPCMAELHTEGGTAGLQPGTASTAHWQLQPVSCNISCCQRQQQPSGLQYPVCAPGLSSHHLADTPFCRCSHHLAHTLLCRRPDPRGWPNQAIMTGASSGETACDYVHSAWGSCMPQLICPPDRLLHALYCRRPATCRRSRTTFLKPQAACVLDTRLHACCRSNCELGGG